MRVLTYCVTAAPGAAQTLRRGFASMSPGHITLPSYPWLDVTYPALTLTPYYAIYRTAASASPKGAKFKITDVLTVFQLNCYNLRPVVDAAL